MFPGLMDNVKEYLEQIFGDIAIEEHQLDSE
jgi:hypothetical protein